MSKIATPDWNQNPSQDEQEPVFKPLGPQEAQALRGKLASVSPWRVIAVQALVACGVALLAYAISGKTSIGWSAAYGGVAVIIPAIVFARGLTSRLSSVNAGAAMMGFFLWEAVKIGLTVAMLFAAPRLVAELSWPALLVGLVVTMKSVWVMLWMQPKTGGATPK
jgi:ATP synthase protein I